MATHAALGAKALDSSDFPAAITHYTNALKVHPESPDYYIKRSTAYSRLTPPNAPSALRDAEIAIVAATKRSRRELIAQGQMRRAVSLYSLERWRDAEFCFAVVKEMTPSDKAVGIWESKIRSKLDALPEGDERGKLTVKKVPDVEIPTAPEESKKEKDITTVKPASTTESKQDSAPVVSAAVVPTPPSKIKHDWYQSGDKVYFTLLAKGVPEDTTVIDIQPQSVSPPSMLIN